MRRKPFLVGFLVVVELRREVEEDGLLIADDFEPVPAVTRDADGLLVVFADDELVRLALRGRVLAVVVDTDLDSPLRTDKVVDLSVSMAVPGPDNARVTKGVIAHRRFGVVQFPVFAEYFDEVSSLIRVYLQIAYINTLNTAHYELV